MTAPSKLIVMADWDDAPHLSAAARAQLESEILPYQRDARMKGVPALGSGVIYQVPESDIKVPDFPLPAHWPRGFSLDVAWNRTAALWVAYNRETGVRYLYSEHYRAQAEPPIHAEAIKARGGWIPGRSDPAARGRSQVDGRKLFQQYRDLGIDIHDAPNAVEAGIYEVWTLLAAGKLKVFASCVNWFQEYRLYRRDKKGQVVKKNDHLMDATRYLILAGVDWLKVQPADLARSKKSLLSTGGGPQGWMG